ncbi:glycoside hydrolase superfamily, partial [Baffinella frigidus]
GHEELPELNVENKDVREHLFSGHEELPELNVENKDVREYLFSVGKFWLEMGVNVWRLDVAHKPLARLPHRGVDGWRLDVAHELPPAFWRDFRTACSEANPEHVLLGEVIHGDYNTWVGPSKGLLHSGTNYQLSKAIWSSLRDKNFWELNTSLQRDLTLYRD